MQSVGGTLNVDGGHDELPDRTGSLSIKITFTHGSVDLNHGFQSAPQGVHRRPYQGPQKNVKKQGSQVVKGGPQKILKWKRHQRGTECKV